MRLEGYSDYEIDIEKGQVWSYKSNRYVSTTNDKGYYLVNITNDIGVSRLWYIHRLIWTVANGEIPEGMQVNHIDENKGNNSISNLNLMTPKENTNWGSGIKRSTNKRSKPIVALKGGDIKLYFSSTQDAERNGFQSSNISLCCNKKQNLHKGFQWMYMDEYLADWWEQEMEKALS
jgi:hypothetical protein